MTLRECGAIVGHHGHNEDPQNKARFPADRIGGSQGPGSRRLPLYRERAAVYGYLEKVKSHPTAEEVYRAVRRDMPRISLATVYKALEALVESRLATKLTNGDAAALRLPGGRPLSSARCRHGRDSRFGR